MSIRVRVQENFATFGLDIWLVEKGERSRDVLGPDGQWRRLDSPDSATADALEPSYRLPENAGRALLDALVRHYDGGEDTRNLRRDYDAERARVDKMLSVLASVTERVAHPLAREGTT